MVKVRIALVVLLVTAFAAAALASAGITGYLSAFDADVVLRRAALAGLPGNAKAVAALDKVRSFVEGPKAAATYAGEIGAAAKAANLLTKKLPAEAGLLSQLVAAGNRYTLEIGAARGAFAANLTTLTGAAKKKATKALAKADKALAKAGAALKSGAQLASLATAAKLLGVQPDDGIPDGAVDARNAAIDSTGRFLYVAMHGPLGGPFAGHVRQFRVAADGSLSNLAPPAVQAGASVTCVATHPTLPVAYVTSEGDHLLHLFAIGTDGTLSPMTPPTVDLAAVDTANLGFSTVPRMVVPSAEGDLLFILANSVGGSPVITFGLNTDGTVAGYRDWEAGTPWTYTLTVPRRNPSTNELRVYTASPYENALFHAEVRAFDVTQAGTITSLYAARAYAQAIVASPGGAYVYASVNYNPGPGFVPGMLVLPRLPAYSYLDEYQAPLQITGVTPTAIVVNSLSTRLYTGSSTGTTIGEFATAGTAIGALTTATIASPPVVSLTMSRDDKFLFAVRQDAQGVAPAGIVAVFGVDGTTGALTAR